MDSSATLGYYPALNPKEEKHLRELLGPDYFKREFTDEHISCVLSCLLPSMKQRLKMKEILPFLRQKPVLIDTEIHRIENSQEQAMLLVEFLMNKGIIGIQMLYLCLLESSEQADGVPGHYHLARVLKEIVQAECGIGLTAATTEDSVSSCPISPLSMIGHEQQGVDYECLTSNSDQEKKISRSDGQSTEDNRQKQRQLSRNKQPSIERSPTHDLLSSSHDEVFCLITPAPIYCVEDFIKHAYCNIAKFRGQSQSHSMQGNSSPSLNTGGHPINVVSTCPSPPPPQCDVTPMHSETERGSVRRSGLVQETQGDMYVLCWYSPVEQMMIPILAVSISISRESTTMLCQTLVQDYDQRGFMQELQSSPVRFKDDTVHVNVLLSPDGYEVVPKQKPTQITKEAVDRSADDLPPYLTFQILRKHINNRVDQQNIRVCLGTIGLDKAYEYEPVIAVMTSSSPSTIQGSTDNRGYPPTTIKEDISSIKPCMKYRTRLKDKPELHDLMNEVAAKIRSKWKLFGIELGLTPDELESFSAANHGNALLCFSSVFTVWRDRMTREPYSWQTVVETLMAPAIGELKLAQQIIVTRTS